MYVFSRFSHVRLFVIPWTVAHQVPLPVGFSRQEYWSGLPCPPSGDLPESGIKPKSLMSSALTGRFLNTSATWEAHQHLVSILMCEELGSHHTHLCNKKNLDNLKNQWLLLYPLVNWTYREKHNLEIWKESGKIQRITTKICLLGIVVARAIGCWEHSNSNWVKCWRLSVV